MFLFLRNTNTLTLILLLISFDGLKAQAPNWNAYKDNPSKLRAIFDYGRSCIHKQQYDEAISTFSTGLQIARQASLDSFIATNMLYLGRSYQYKSVFDSVKYYLTKAQTIDDERHYVALQAAVQVQTFP